MIKTIYVRDFALIDELEIHPGPGLNIITGQTGAGKSILVGALNMILGERADTESIRTGAGKAIAEAIIAINANHALRSLLEEAGVEPGKELILRREIRDSGSRAFINDTPVPINILKQVGDLLVDLHGQHDHQLLLREENHRLVIDSNAAVSPLLAAWQEQYHRVLHLQKELRQLTARERELREKQELYRFQLKELESARLDPAELAELEQEMTLLDNAETLDQKAGMISSLGGESEIDLIDIMSKVEHALYDLSSIEPEFEHYLREFKAAKITVQETVQFAERYRAGIEFNPSRLDYLRSRQNEIRKLEKKYGMTVEELIDHCATLKRTLNLADNFDLEIEKLKNVLEKELESLATQAVLLSEARRKTGEMLADGIVRELQNLGIAHATFEVRTKWLTEGPVSITIGGNRVACGETGAEHVSFYISTNKGEQPKPLSKTASGGEISRIMLALKSILAKEQSLPVMIFDEIDTGISGSVAEKVGITMRSLAEHCQILAITHHPQIASQAHHHFKVSKSDQGDRTTTRIDKLDDEQHVYEVASLMSGEKVSESTLQSARELIAR